jgi:3-deoxy-D-manno-octulosonic-acid transferase
VGGGFTPYLHSVIEPAVYGLPVAFGPRFGRQRATTELLEIGVGKTVETPADLIAWMERLRADESLMAQIRQKALDFVEHNAKAARIVAQEILK